MTGNDEVPLGVDMGGNFSGPKDDLQTEYKVVEYTPDPKSIEAQTLVVVEHILASIPVKSGGFDRLIFVDEDAGIEKVYKFKLIKKKTAPKPKTPANIWKAIKEGFKK